MKVTHVEFEHIPKTVHFKFKHIFSRVLRDSTPRFIGPSVRPSVRHTLLLLGFLRSLALLLLPK